MSFNRHSEVPYTHFGEDGRAFTQNGIQSLKVGKFFPDVAFSASPDPVFFFQCSVVFLQIIDLVSALVCCSSITVLVHCNGYLQPDGIFAPRL